MQAHTKTKIHPAGSKIVVKMDETYNSSSFYNKSFRKDGQNFIAITGSNKLMDLIDLNETTNSSNATHIDWRDTYKPILDVLLLVILIVVMLSMGCEITWKNVFLHVKKPIGLFIGIISQFGVMPLSAFVILLISGIQGLHATGVLIIACCPGGVLSNTFTYFCDGNLALSIAMTCTSTVIAMGMMPFNVWLYGRRFESDDLVIPYEKMAISLITVTSPVIVGMLLKYKFPRIAAFITKFGSYCAILIMFVCIGMEIILFPNMFTGVPIKLYIVILSLPTIGLTLGYGIATALKQSKNIRKTIAIECGVQNVPVALTIIALSFPLEMQEDIVLLPWLYGFAMMSGCTVICLTYHCRKKYAKKQIPSHDYHVVEKLDPLLQSTQKDQSLNGIKTEKKRNFMISEKEISNVQSSV